MDLIYNIVSSGPRGYFCCIELYIDIVPEFNSGVKEVNILTISQNTSLKILGKKKICIDNS